MLLPETVVVLTELCWFPGLIEIFSIKAGEDWEAAGCLCDEAAAEPGVPRRSVEQLVSPNNIVNNRI